MDGLTLGNACLLADIVRAAQGGQNVKWLNESDDVVEGVARSIGNDSGGFLGRDEDVRGAFLRITLLSGMEYFMPISDVMERLGNHTLFFK